MRIGKTATVHFISQVVVTLAGFVATWLIAFVLGADGLGQYAIVVSLGVFWLVVPANAVGTAIKKRISEGDSPAAFFGAGIALNAVITIAIAAAVLSASELLGGIVSRNREVMIVLIKYDVEIAFMLVMTVAFQTVQSGLQGQKRVGASGWLKASERVLRTVFQVIALLSGLAVAGITFGHAGSLFVVAVVGFFLSRSRPRLPTAGHIRSLLAYARYSWMGSLRGRVFGWLDTIVLSFFVSASLIGIYEAAWGIASMLAIASGSISQTLFPEVSELSTDASYSKIRHYLNEALVFSAIFMFPGLLGALVLGDRILQFYRPEFSQGTGILLILIAAYLVDVFAAQFTNVINGIDRPDVAFRVNIIFITMNATLNVILVWQYGWYGAAVATATSSALRAIAGYVMLERILGDLSIPLGEHARQVVAAVVMAAVVYLLIPYAPTGRPGTVLLVAVGAVVYGGVLFGIAPRVRKKALALKSQAV